MTYDVIIIGGGPAGLISGIYAARYGLKAVIISKSRGGLAATAYRVCNFPSYREIKGFELMQKIISQVEEMNIPINYEEVINIEKTKEGFAVSSNKKKYSGKKIIFAAGTERIRLNAPGEGKFLGKGVSYCATCDAAFFKDKEVAVAGGSNAALSSAILLSEYASTVYIIYRGNKFRSDPVWINLVDKNKRIKPIFNEEIIEIIGKDKVEKIKLKSNKELKVNGVFIEVGSVPETKLLKNLKINLNEKGYVIVDKEQKTNMHGFFAAGDVTDNELRQIITACSEGAIAAFNVYQQIEMEKK